MWHKKRKATWSPELVTALLPRCVIAQLCGPKWLCRSLIYAIGRMDISPLGISFSLREKKKTFHVCRDLSVQNFILNFNGYSCKMFPCISSAICLICLCEHFKGDWLFGEWPSLRIFYRFSECLSVYRCGYVYTVESG